IRNVRRELQVSIVGVDGAIELAEPLEGAPQVVEEVGVRVQVVGLPQERGCLAKATSAIVLLGLLEEPDGALLRRVRLRDDRAGGERRRDGKRHKNATEGAHGSSLPRRDTRSQRAYSDGASARVPLT